MAAYSGDSQALSPCSTFHEPGPACSVYSALEELPFLYTIINKDSRRKVARCAAILLWLIYLVSRILPYFFRRPLFAVLVWIDNLCLLAACYFEHAFPQASYFLWDRIIRTPQVLHRRLMIVPARHLSETAGTYLRRASESRLGSVMVDVRNHADKDVAEVLRVVADTYEELVNRFLPPVEAIIQPRADDSELTPLSLETGTMKAIAVDDPAAEPHATNKGEFDLIDFEITGTRNPGPEASTVDHLYVGEPHEDGKASIEDVGMERRFHISEDEGYASGANAAISLEAEPKDSRRKILQVPRVRSMLDPLDEGVEVDARHGSISPYIQPAPLMLTSPRPTLGPQRSWSGNDGMFPSRATFDEMPGLRRQSQTSAEAKRLVTISVDAASRAHHHWLRPCAACAQKAAEEKPKKRLGRLIAEEMQGSGEDKSENGVYKRTVHWVKRQEERIKQL